MRIDMGIGLDMDKDRDMGLDIGMHGPRYVNRYVGGYGDAR